MADLYRVLDCVRPHVPLSADTVHKVLARERASHTDAVWVEHEDWSRESSAENASGVPHRMYLQVVWVPFEELSKNAC